MESLLNTDRTLDPSVISRRRRRLFIRFAVFGALALIGLFLLYGWIRPSVDRDSLRLAVVEMGSVEETVEADGLVLPEHEQIITSPFDSRVLSVFHRAGDRLRKGEPILALDSSEAHLALERVKDNLAVKQSQKAQLEVELKTAQFDLASRLNVKKLQADLLAAKAEQQRKLFTLGASSKDQVSQAELEEKVAQIELEQLLASSENNEEISQSRLESIETELSLLKKEQVEMQRLLQLASTRVEQEGVLTWVLDQEGATVRKSEPIARISDLARFRIEASISDVHAGKLLPGMPVKVRVNEFDLGGAVSSVNPTIQRGVMTLRIALTDPLDSRLHSNMRVDVYVATASKPNVLRIQRGTVADAKGVQPLFLLKGGSAERVELLVGLVGHDYAEVVSGAALGDTAIISAMTNYLHLTSVTVD